MVKPGREALTITNALDLVSWAKNLNESDRRDLIGLTNTHASLSETVIMVGATVMSPEVGLPHQLEGKQS